MKVLRSQNVFNISGNKYWLRRKCMILKYSWLSSKLRWDTSKRLKRLPYGPLNRSLIRRFSFPPFPTCLIFKSTLQLLCASLCQRDVSKCLLSLYHTNTHTHTHTHTQTHTHTHTYTHTDTQTQTQTNTHRHTDTDTQTQMCARTHTHKRAHTHMHTHTCTHTNAHNRYNMAAPCLNSLATTTKITKDIFYSNLRQYSIAVWHCGHL